MFVFANKISQHTDSTVHKVDVQNKTTLMTIYDVWAVVNDLYKMAFNDTLGISTVTLHFTYLLARLAWHHAVVSSYFLSFLQCLISEVTKRISNKLWHTLPYDCYFKKICPNSPGHLPPRAWGQKPYWLWILTEHISATEHNIGNKFVNLQGPP